MIAAAALAASLVSAPPSAYWQDESVWALAWAPSPRTVIAVAGDVGDMALLAEARASMIGYSPYLPSWYPWLFPRGDPPDPGPATPMQDCFETARRTCRAQGETVCWAYFIPALEGACLFACRSANGDCAPPPPIPPAYGGVTPPLNPKFEAACNAAAILLESMR